MTSKGLSVRTMLVLTAAVMFAGLITGLYTNSPLRDMIDQGKEKVSTNTDYTVTVESKEKLSDLAMLSYHRAHPLGCKAIDVPSDEYSSGQGGLVKRQIEGDTSGDGGDVMWDYSDQGWGYPNLAETYLSQYPNCYGAEGTPASGIDLTSPSQNTGLDMEGIFSREKFEIPEERETPVRLQFNSEGNTWLESWGGVSVRAAYGDMAPKCESQDKYVIDAEGGSAYEPVLYPIFFPASVSDSRVSPTDAFVSADESPSPYCQGGDTHIEQHVVYLCPGDKGVVQVNRGKPLNQGESPTSEIFPSIRITDPGESCGTGGAPPNFTEIEPQLIENSGYFSTGDELEVDAEITNWRIGTDAEVRASLYDNGGSGDRLLSQKEDTLETGGSTTKELNSKDSGLPILDDISMNRLEPYREDSGEEEECYVRLVLEERSSATGGNWEEADEVRVNINPYKTDCPNSAIYRAEIQEVSGDQINSQTWDFHATVENTGLTTASFQLWVIDPANSEENRVLRKSQNGLFSSYTEVPKDGTNTLHAEGVSTDSVSSCELTFELHAEEPDASGDTLMDSYSEEAGPAC